VTVALVLAWPLLAPAARRAWLAVGIALVVLVGCTRMWLGVHFLSDVLGGWALGAGWTLLVALVFGALPGGRAALRSGAGR
jgi:undecaprenyl-diphosphatase